MTDSHPSKESPSEAAPEPASGQVARFADLDLPEALLAGLDAVGYETPSPIQIQAIPHLLAGRDLVGRAPTGTGKTAAFSLPLIAKADLRSAAVQILVLTPTRELALQVSEAMQTYASRLKGFHVLPVYGGQDYAPQLQKLKRGVQAVVGTPGRVTDHLRRGTLKLGGLRAVVLDEADEMLRMGFVDEVEWILEQTPAERQVILFSATMPKEVQAIARRHLKDPQEISIKAKTATADTIRQRCWMVRGVRKMEALTRLLEVEPVDGVLVFARTKSSTTDIAERLEQRGFRAAALNGDMAQRQREQTVDRLKKGTLDVLVATDVAARGLDVDRISHVINFDVPYDTEAYIHRIGRTGRAGRKGEAILFVGPREQRMLGAIERATRQKIKPLQLPTVEAVREVRLNGFKDKITEALGDSKLHFMRELVTGYQQEHEDVPLEDIAAALAALAGAGAALRSKEPAAEGEGYGTSAGDEPAAAPGRPPRRRQARGGDEGFDRYRLEVGHDHGVAPGNIVGAIANEAGLDAANIGRVEIRDDHSTVQLPVGMPAEVFRDLQKVWVCGQALKITRIDEAGGGFKRKERDASGDKRSFASKKRKPHSKSNASGRHESKAGKKDSTRSASKSSAKSSERSSSKLGAKPTAKPKKRHKKKDLKKRARKAT
ncbi:MAG: DEAD/DEAH box helicase [Pseudomonadales bacterium]